MSAQIIDVAIVAAMMLAVIGIFCVSTTMLTHWGLHYLTSGGAFYEKLHPATYFAVLAFGLLLIRNADPIDELTRMISGAKLLLIYLFCWLCLLIQMITLDRPFTVIIDTFLLPLLLALVVWALSARQRRPVILALHAAILINIAIGYYEYGSGHRLFPLTVGDVVVLGEWRSAALLGHPLTASGVIAGYVLALIFQPSICSPALIRVPLIAFSLGSLMAFGGRTALVTVLLLGAVAATFQFVRLLRGARIPLLAVVALIGLAFVGAAGIFVAFDLGFFDKMLLRFSSDKGSASARLATFNLLSQFDWQELLLGPNPARAAALQNGAGLKFGIENFWVSCIVQFGIIHTVLLTIGLAAFLIEVLKRASGGAWAILVLMLAIAASSVSFSSKNIQLAQFVLLIALLLPRARTAARALRSPLRARPIPATS
ncbi:VpsF family polysaccharide biosynthesis protein [Rhodopseudomonas sp. NSM]|uniref:VpsF family polysaccharide biosynthesis protein n=1 Tax=Rhodopseudomonas sp. NSM TaxID=3457630 RepID=UPI0040375BAD